MEVKQPICWQQGTFLQPQHFQQNDLYHQYQRVVNRLNQPFFWGVDQFEINKAALANQFVEIDSCRILFRSCRYVEAPGNSFVTKRSFASHWEHREKPLMVYVGVKSLQNNMPNVTIVRKLNEISNVTTCFVALEQPEETPDIYMNGPMAHVRKCYFVLQVFFGDEAKKAVDFELLPVARLIQKGEEVIADPHFIPPCLRLESSESLVNMVRELRDDIAGRARQLDVYKVSPGRHSVDIDPRHMIYFTALQLLNRYTPLLTHYLNMKAVPPWMVYSSLVQLVGELSAYSDRHDVYGEGSESRGVGIYEHEALEDTMLRVKAVIHRLCDHITFVPHQFIRLVLENNYYVAKINPELFEKGFVYYLRAHIPSDIASAKRLEDYDIASHVKVAAANRIEGLIDRSLPGVSLEVLATVPPSVPSDTAGVYSRIDPADSEWQGISSTGQLAVFWPNAPKGLNLEFVAVRR
jgi:type VI secretion system protein ImpJ